jgi:hypothetical protein
MGVAQIDSTASELPFHSVSPALAGSEPEREHAEQQRDGGSDGEEEESEESVAANSIASKIGRRDPWQVGFPLAAIFFD